MLSAHSVPAAGALIHAHLRDGGGTLQTERGIATRARLSQPRERAA